MSIGSRSNYSILENAEKKLRSYASDKVWAEISVSVIATLTKVFEKNMDLDVKFQILSKNKNTLVSLSLLSWFLPKEIQSLLQLELHKIKNRQDLNEVEFILTSINHCRIYLREVSDRKGPEHLFGNILDKRTFENLSKIVKLKIRNEQLGPKIPERNRIGVGYRDKGNLPDIARGGALGSITDRSKMNEIELRRKETEGFNSFLKGFLE
jgi:hypothetical protein